MDLHKQFLDFTEQALKSDILDRSSENPDLHSILEPLADGDDVYDLMGNIPDERIGEVLGWAMNVDMPVES